MRSRKIYAVRTRGWQLDYRPDGWIPLRTAAKDDWWVLRLGWFGCITLGRLHPARDITVTIDVDTTHFVDNMRRLNSDFAELRSQQRYRRRIASERALGLAHVEEQLDGLCRDLGLDPHAAWRDPRVNEEQEARDRAALRSLVTFGGMVLNPRALWILGGDLS